MAQLSPRLQARLAKVPDIARAAAANAMEEGAAELVAEMKRLAPVQSGALRDSIGWTWGDVPAGSFTIADVRSGKNAGEQYATLRIRIYTGSREAYYARWQEFGTKNQPAQPFFHVTWRKEKAKFRNRIRAAVRAAIRAEFK